MRIFVLHKVYSGFVGLESLSIIGLQLLLVYTLLIIENGYTCFVHESTNIHRRYLKRPSESFLNCRVSDGKQL